VKVVLTVGGLAPEFGGPSRSVPALAEALARETIEVDLIACESQPGHEAPVLPDVKSVKTHLLPVQSREGRWRARRNDFFTAVCESAESPNTVVHDNGLWLPTNHAVAAAARELRRPLVISPRGMLSTWATKFHRWKKRAAWTLFQRRDLESATALHATAMMEAEEFRRAGLRQPIAVLPNGVNLPPALADSAERNRQTRTALFLSRVHPKKGLLDLVEAWARVRPTNWRMVVAGNDEENHRAQIEAAVRRARLESSFSFIGAVNEAAKWNLYREADLFILPSHSENFGIVVAEALAAGVPAITTRGTPWRELAERQCGWWTEIGATPLGEALAAATAATDEERSAMGLRGRALIEEKYSWSWVAAEFKDVYEWLLGKAERPACVRLD
jgi:glycosyltransferase involved in cell wall biosynthesis